MKRIYSLLAFTFICSISSGQIILDSKLYIYHKAFFLIEISENNFKYEVTDSTGFSLYNLDFSPFLLNVTPPIPIGQPPSYYLISYITSSLFDCDSTNIEYVISRADYLSNFYIYRTDGTLLFQQDSVTGYYAIAYAGSIYQNPIRRTPNGVKLFLSDNKSSGQDSLYIYSLCGELPNSINESLYNTNYVSVYPNPSNGKIQFQVSKIFSSQEIILKIYNASLANVKNVRLNNEAYTLSLDEEGMSNGIYFFTLSDSYKIIQQGKFIISK